MRAPSAVDVRGATILPGLVDTHPHVLHFGVFAHPLVDLSDARSHDDIVSACGRGRRPRRRASGSWPRPSASRTTSSAAPGEDLAEGRLPDRSVLDRATTDHPVFIQAWAPVLPNVCALNSRGLERLRIGRETPDRVDNVWIEKDAAGEPTGILRGSVNNYYTNDSFMNSLLREVPLLQPEAVLPGTRQAMAAYNRLGVTTVYEGHAMGRAEIGAYRALRAGGELTLRVLTTLEAESYGLPWTQPLSMPEFRENLEDALAMTDTSDDFLRHRGRDAVTRRSVLAGVSPHVRAVSRALRRADHRRHVRRGGEGAGRARLLRRPRPAPQLHRGRLPRPRRVPRSRRGGRTPRSGRRPRLDPAARLLPHGARGPTVCGPGLRRHDQPVVHLGQGRHVRRAHRRARAARSDPAAPHARRGTGGGLRKRLGAEERLRAPRAGRDASLLRQRAAERWSGAARDP